MAIPPSGSELFLAPDLASNPIPGNNFTPSKDIHGVSLESCTPISNELTGPRNPQSPGGGSASPTRAEITETLLESFGQKSSSMQVLANINKRKAGEIEDADNSPDSTRVCLTVEQKQGRSANDREPDNSDYDSNHKSCNVSPGLKTAHIDINLNSDLDYQEMRRLCDHDHSDPALRVSRTSNDNRQDWDYHSLPDYSPPTSTLDGGNPKLLFKLDWSPNNKLDLSSDPDRHLLHEAEIHLASALRLSCAKYLCAKRRMFKGRLQSLKMGREGWKTDAQKSCKISMNKASKMCLAYENVGWFKAEHFIQYINKDANSSIDGVNESDITVLSSSSPHFRSEENATAVADTNLDLFQDDRPSTSSDLSEQDIWAVSDSEFRSTSFGTDDSSDDETIVSSFSFGVEHEEKSCASGFIQYNRLPLREQPGPTLAGKVNKSQHGLRALNVGQDNVSPVGEDTCEDTDDVPFIGIKRMVRKASGRPSQLVVRGEGPGTSGEETEEIPIIAARGKIQKTTHGGKLRRRAYGPRRPIPKVLAEADAPDKMLVEMREKGCTWAEIQKAWHEQTGQKISSSTMVTRHARIIQNTDHLQRDDEKRLLAAEAAVEHDFRRQKWRLVVEAMSRAGAAHYSEAFIQRHFEILSQIPITAGNTSDEDFELPQPAGPMPHASESMRCRNRCGRCGKYYKISSGLQYHIERHPSCASEPLKAHKSNISLEPSATGSAPIDYPADTPASRAFDRNNTSSKLVIGNVADHGPIPAQQNASQNTEGSFLGETNATELTQSADSYPHFLRLHPNASGAAKSASSKRCDKCGRRYRGRSGLNYHKARYPDCVSQTPRPHISTKKGKNSKSKPKAKEWIHGLPKPPRSQQILSNNLTSPIVNQNLKPTSQVDQTENSRPIRSAIINMGSEKFDRLGADPAPTGTRALLSARMKEVRARRRAAGDSGRYGSSPNPRKVADKAASGVPLAGPRHNVLFPSLTEDQSPLPQESTPDITKLVPRERRPTEYLRMENKSKQRRFSCKSCGRHYTTPSAVNAHCRRFPNCVSDGPVRRDSRTQPSGRKAGNRRSARKIQKAALGVIFPNLLTRQVTPIRSLVGEPPLEDQIQPQINSERPTPPANTVSNVADQTQPDPPKPVGVKPFGCGKCGKKYTNKDGLWVHYDCKPDCNPEWRRIKQAKRAARRAAWAAAAANSRTTATTELAVTHPNNVVTDVAAVAEHSNAFTAEPSTYATTKEAAAVAGLLDTSAAEPLIETITNEAAGARPSDTLEARMVTDVSSQEQTPEKLSYQDKKLSGKHYNWVGCLSGHDASAPALFDTSTAAQENQA